MRLYLTRSVIAAAWLLALCVPQTAAAGQAQDPTPAAPAPASQTPAVPSDRAVDPSEPDFTLIGLPTTLRMPRHASAFRVTHRFTRSLSQGNFGDLLGDGFGTDGGAQIGLEYRFGIFSGTQVGVHRTSDKTIQFFGQQQLTREAEGKWLGVDMIVTIEGRDNFQDIYSPAVGAIISKKLGVHGAIYVEPIWVGNTNAFDLVAGADNDTFMVGVGTRLRLRSKSVLRGRSRAAVRLRPWNRLRQLRHRNARGRALVSDQLLGRLRNHDGADGAGRVRQR